MSTFFSRAFQVGEKRAALRGFRRLQNSLKPPEGEGAAAGAEIGGDYLRAAKEIARLLHERGDIEDAKNALSEAANKGSLDDIALQSLSELFATLLVI